MIVRFVTVQYHQSDVPVEDWGRAAAEEMDAREAKEMRALVSFILVVALVRWMV